MSTHDFVDISFAMFLIFAGIGIAAIGIGYGKALWKGTIG